MSNPNLINVTNISAKTTGQSVGTSPTSIVSNSVDSFKSLKINSLRVANLDDFAAYNITASVYQGDNVLYSLAYNVSVPSTATLILVSRDSQLYLEEGQSLRLSGSQAQKFDAVCSYEEISREEYLLFTNENITGLNAAQGNLVPFPILENSLVNFSFNVPSTMISPTSQTFYWEINNITNALPEYFAATSAAIPIPSNATTASFSIATQFIGDLSRSSTRWGVRVYKEVIGGPLVYESGSFTIELPTASASFTKNTVTENSSFAITATIGNIGTRTSTIPITIQNSGTATSDDFTGGWPTTANLSIGANTITYNVAIDGDPNETLSAALYNGSTLIANVLNGPVSIRSQLYNSALTFTNENIVGTTNAQGAQTFLIKENSTINFAFTLANSQTLAQTFYWKINHISDSFNDQFVSSSGSFTINSGETTGTFSASTNFIGVNTRTASFWTVQLLTGSVNGTVVYETSQFSTVVSVLSASFDTTSTYESNTIVLTINLSNVGTKTLPIPVTIQNSGTATSADFANGWPTSASLIIGNTAVNYIVAADGNTEDNETLSAAIYYGDVLLLNASNNPVTIIDTIPRDPNFMYVTSGMGVLELGNASTVGTTLPSNWFILKDSASDIERMFYGDDAISGSAGWDYTDDSRVWAPVDIRSSTLSTTAMNILNNVDRGTSVASNANPYYQTDHMTTGNMLNISSPSSTGNAQVFGTLAPFFNPSYMKTPPIGNPPSTSVDPYINPSYFNPYFYYSDFNAVSFYSAQYDITHTVWHARMPNFGKPVAKFSGITNMSRFAEMLWNRTQYPPYKYSSYNYTNTEAYKRPSGFTNTNGLGYEFWGSDIFISSMGWISVQHLSAGLLNTDQVTGVVTADTGTPPFSPRIPMYPNPTNPLDFLQTSGQDQGTSSTKSWLYGADGFAIGIGARVARSDGNLRRLLVSVDPAAVSSNNWNNSSYMRIRYEYTNPTTIYEITFYNDSKTNPSPVANTGQEGFYKYKMVLVTGTFNRDTNIVTTDGVPNATNSQLVTRSWTSNERNAYQGMPDPNIYAVGKYDVPMTSGDQGFTYNNVSNNYSQFIPQSNKSYVIGVGKGTNRVFYGKIWGPDTNSPNGYHLAFP
jgi:hypothetical protein